jgi:hypothetical protein
MSEYAYVWSAEFSDGTVISQFSEKGEEVPFSEVEKRMPELEVFTLYASNDDLEEYVVDIVEKTIDTPEKSVVVKGNNPELIYKRRNQVRAEVGTNKIIEARTFFLVGLKTDTEEHVVNVFGGLGRLKKKVMLEQKGKKTDITPMKR